MLLIRVGSNDSAIQPFEQQVNTQFEAVLAIMIVIRTIQVPLLESPDNYFRSTDTGLLQLETNQH